MTKLRVWLLLVSLFLALSESVQGQTADTEPLLPIGVIQGAGDVSPFVGQVVSFRGVVTGLYEDRNAAGIVYYTLFVQDLPGYEDGDPATSDGMPIFMGRRRPAFAIGDQVRVTGQVTEFYGLTELDDSGLQIVREAANAPLPDPIFIDPPAAARELAAYFEPLEGMRVAVRGAARVVGPTFSGCGFAVVTESVSALRIFRRQLADPIGEVLPILHNSDVACGDFPVLKNGDLVIGLAGPLIYHFDQFKLVQQETAVLQTTLAPLPPLPKPPDLAAAQFSIASFNVENYFDTIDDTGNNAEPKPTAVELALKQSKLAATLVEVLGCPTVVGIQEVENAPLLETLAKQVQADCGFAYAVIHRESADGRGIDVAFLVDVRRVTVDEVMLRQGCTAVTTTTLDGAANCPPGQSPLFARPPLEMTAQVDGYPITFLVNHFKSKREGEAETAAWRLAQANFVNDLVTRRLAADPQAAVVVLGDFNDYEHSPPLLAMTGAGGALVNALAQVPDEERYSYVYAGVAQLIDGILLSPLLAPQVMQAAIMHINADFPDAWGADAGTVYRATDHDLPLVVLALPTASTAISLGETAVLPNTPLAEQPADRPTALFTLWGAALLIGAILLGWTLLRRRS